MRPALLLALFPALAGAQDIPSLQRPGAALPITASTAVLEARLGGPGGLFAAAQLALRGEEGLDALVRARAGPDPLARLDVAYGLAAHGGERAYRALIPMLGDPDPRVMEEADHGIALAGARAIPALRFGAYQASPDAADRAVALLWNLNERDEVRRIARSPRAGGRAGALRLLSYEGDEPLSTFEAAAHDEREEVRRAAMRRVVFGPKTEARARLLARLSRDPSPAVRRSLVAAMDEDPGRVLDPEYERAQRYGAVGSRRNFARMVNGELYRDPARLLGATATLARLVNDPEPSVGDVAVSGLYLFLEDRLGNVAYGSGPLDVQDVPWDRLSPPTVALLRRGVGRRLHGPLAFKAAVVLARLHDPRAYPVLAAVAFAPDRGERTLALIALGVSGDRRATPRLLELAHKDGLDYPVFDALGRLRDPAAVPALLRDVETDHVGKGLAAAYALAAIGDRSVAPAMVKLTKESPVGTNLYIPLGRLGGPVAGRFLLDRLENGPENLIQYAASGLGELRDDPATVAKLKQIAKTGGNRAAYAQSALGTIADRARRR